MTRREKFIEALVWPWLLRRIMERGGKAVRERPWWMPQEVFEEVSMEYVNWVVHEFRAEERRRLEGRGAK